MVLKKLNLFLMCLSTLFLTSLFFNEKMKMIEMKTFTIMKEMAPSFFISTQWNYKSKMFLLMVILITMVVSVYSESYMEHYNNKKFFNLLLSFFLSMVVLSSSLSMINLMMGWEMLGLTSLCLIMFYPSKTSKINSIMTMIFNRMGDAVMILILGILIFDMMNNFSNQKITKQVCMMFLLCSLTKSAQFPMSAWLPAAMAAPTPISAMVHSSTLVTAGIFLMVKIHNSLLVTSTMEILMYLSLLSFFMGGWMSNMEVDYKKMIAYSTMSQISMIMFFSTSLMIECSLTHMMYHAFFKTLLFCTAGVMFMNYWSEQMKNKIKLKYFNVLMKLFLTTSIFCMTGLLFSASYFTKDLYLEMMIFSTKTNIIFLFTILAALMTMFYSIKMMNPLKKYESEKAFYNKNSMSTIMVMMCVTTLGLESMMKTGCFKDLSPQISSWEVATLIMILMMCPLAIKVNFKPTKLMSSLNMEISHMKYQMYSSWQKFMKMEKMSSMLQTDMMFFKKYYMSPSLKKMKIHNNNSMMVICLFIFMKLML